MEGVGGVGVKGEDRREREREKEREEAGLHDTYSHLATGFPNIKA